MRHVNFMRDISKYKEMDSQQNSFYEARQALVDEWYDVIGDYGIENDYEYFGSKDNYENDLELYINTLSLKDIIKILEDRNVFDLMESKEII